MMKRISNIRTLLAVLAAALICAACSSSKEVDQPKAPSISGSSSGSTTSSTFNSTGGDIQFTIQSDSPWTASVKAGTATTKAGETSWITIDPMSGPAGRTEVTVRIAANTTKEARSATISFTSNGLSTDFAVQQEAQEELNILKITYTGDYFTIPAIGGTSVNGTIDWGDGTLHSNYLNATPHTYAKEGSYNITLTLKNAESFELNDLTGISEIDLSEF